MKYGKVFLLLAQLVTGLLRSFQTQQRRAQAKQAKNNPRVAVHQHFGRMPSDTAKLPADAPVDPAAGSSGGQLNHPARSPQSPD
ncbi:hypothetical protein [Shewanella sp. NFH-SH190041]|uniref:hypothetical protein n=1 Tax=Shewanella sp. NFH-SH190041 TaxID=2950245 RepID=UPI0021C32404|nr:hypothetical protein [Shewanella sp. NFH-SH190041]